MAPAAGPTCFKGTVSGNGVTFNGVPIDPPATAGKHVFRITNVRANVVGLGSQQTPVKAFVSINGVNPIFVTNPNLTVGFIQQGLSFTTLQPATSSACQPTNFPASGAPPNPTILHYSELFGTAFKTRSSTPGTLTNPFPPPPPQNTPGTIYSGETGLAPAGATFQDLGLAHSGTRLKATFTNVPAGAQVFVPTTNQASATSPNAKAVAVQNEAGAAVPVMPAVGNFFPVPVVNGSGTAIWEVIQSDPNTPESFDFPTFVSYNSGGTSQSSPQPVPIYALGGLGSTTSEQEPIVPVGTTAMTLPTSLIYPSFDNGVNMVNPLVQRFAAFNITACGAGRGIGGILPPGSPTGAMGFAVDENGALAPSQNFIVTGTSASEGIMISASASSTSNHAKAVTSSWLSVNPNVTSTPVTATVSVNPTGLAAGNYAGSITFGASGIGAFTVPVNLTVAPRGPHFVPAGVASVGSYASGMVSPGEAIVIFGERFGPPILVPLALSSPGQVATILGDTRVLFDGVPAPMIYAVDGVVSCFVPFGVAPNPRTQVQVEYKGVAGAPVILPVVTAVPVLLTSNSSGTGQGAVLNANGSVNLPGNPEAAGNIVAFYGTGAGQTTPAGNDGQIYGAPIPALNLPVTVTIAGKPAEIKYAGPAPGLVQGVFQVNAVIPPGTPSGPAPVVVSVGNYVSQVGVTVSVR